MRKIKANKVGKISYREWSLIKIIKDRKIKH